MKVINFVREIRSENFSITDSFLVDDFVENVEDAIRESVKDFMRTDIGRKIVLDTNGDFNWGDAISYIDDDCLYSHGLRKYDEHIETIVVSNDEILHPDIQDEILCEEE